MRKLTNMKFIIIFCFICNFQYSIQNSSECDNVSFKDSFRKVLQVTSNIANEFKLSNYPLNIPLRQEYDFIIVGASPAGCLLANRLTENPNYSVLLLEVGTSEDLKITSAPINAPTLQSTSYNWGYKTEVQERACLSMQNHRCNWPHGRGLGGSSIINYMIWTRGNKKEFDKWSEAGNTGWSYDKILPLYEKVEKSMIEFDNSMDDERESFLTIENATFRSAIVDAFVASAEASNYDQVNYNSGNQIGVGYIQSSTRGHWRQSAARAFLGPIKFRPNLHISQRTWVTKLIMDTEIADKIRIDGVNILRNKQPSFIRAHKEVILSAGAIETPKLLMLSGVGPKEHLDEIKIPVVKDLPVGKILREHIGVYGPIYTINNLTDGLVNSDSVLQIDPIFGLLDGNGPLTSTGIESLLYIKSKNFTDSDPDLPDVEILQSWATIAFDLAGSTRTGLRLSDEAYNAVFRPLNNRRAFQFVPMLLHPKSTGFLQLKSQNPFHHPILQPNFFDDNSDIEILLEAIRETIRIVNQNPFKELDVELYNVTVPGCEDQAFNTDDYWRCYIKHLTATLHHQVSTCKMGPESDISSVVNPELRVHGFENLRIADTSIIPESPSGHTAAFSFLIGEKAADLIRNYHEHDKNNDDSVIMRAKRMPAFDWLDQSEPKEIITATSEPEPAINHMNVIRQTEEDINTTMSLVGLNVFVIRKLSMEFENHSIGDIGSILWGNAYSSAHNYSIAPIPSKSAANTKSTTEAIKSIQNATEQTKTIQNAIETNGIIKQANITNST